MRHLTWFIPMIIALALLLWSSVYNPMYGHLQMAAFLVIIIACTAGIALLMEPRVYEHPGDTNPLFDKPVIYRQKKPIDMRAYRRHIAKEKNNV